MSKQTAGARGVRESLILLALFECRRKERLGAAVDKTIDAISTCNLWEKRKEYVFIQSSCKHSPLCATGVCVSSSGHGIFEKQARHRRWQSRQDEAGDAARCCRTSRCELDGEVEGDRWLCHLPLPLTQFFNKKFPWTHARKRIMHSHESGVKSKTKALK